MGVTQISVSGGLYDDTLMSGRTVEVENTKVRSVGYFKNVARENVRLSLALFLENGASEEELNRIVSWLEVDYFKPFYFDENPNKMAFLMLDGKASLKHDGINGYLEIEMVSNSPFWYSPYAIEDIRNIAPSRIKNTGNFSVYPTIEVIALQDITSDAQATIRNTRTNQEFVITSMQQGETLTIDGENKYVKSNLPNVYRYKDCNEEYLSLEVGDNTIAVSGDIEIRLKYRLQYA